MCANTTRLDAAGARFPIKTSERVYSRQINKLVVSQKLLEHITLQPVCVYAKCLRMKFTINKNRNVISIFVFSFAIVLFVNGMGSRCSA